jgi:hypothetical protein
MKRVARFAGNMQQVGHISATNRMFNAVAVEEPARNWHHNLEVYDLVEWFINGPTWQSKML